MKYRVQAYVFQRPDLTKFWQDSFTLHDVWEDALEEMWALQKKGFRARIVDENGKEVEIED